MPRLQTEYLGFRNEQASENMPWTKEEECRRGKRPRRRCGYPPQSLRPFYQTARHLWSSVKSYKHARGTITSEGRKGNLRWATTQPNQNEWRYRYAELPAEKTEGIAARKIEKQMICKPIM